MRKLALAAGIGVASVALSGCVAFDGEIEGRQVSDKRVQVKFVLCNDRPDDSACRDEQTEPRAGRGPSEDSESRVLLAFRVPEGTTVPDAFTAKNADVMFEPSRSYSAQLMRKAPHGGQAEWFGYVSNPITDERRERFAIRFGLPEPSGNVFRYRPIVGYQEGAPSEKVRCADNVTNIESNNGDMTTYLCADDPPSEDEIRPNLEIPLD